MSSCFFDDSFRKRPSFAGPAHTGANMIILGLYVFFLALFTAIGAALGYVAEESWPGSGSLIAVAVFLAATWVSWVISVRVSERFWPEQPSA